MAVKDFRDLIVWQRSMELVELIYRSTENFSAREIFWVTNQVRRAAVSVASNIAEGQGRNSTNDFLRFLSISRGSIQEIQTQIEIARRLDYINEAPTEAILNLTTEVAKLINGLCRALQSSC